MMGETSKSECDNKPFSILEKYRQLKKEQEHPQVSDEKPKSPENNGTVFKTATNSQDNGSRKRRNENNSGDVYCKRLVTGMYIGNQEVDCGITEFLSPGTGFLAIMKSRYTDFQVNEIDMDGNLVKLTSTTLEALNDFKEEPSLEENSEILPTEKWDALRNIVNSKLASTVNIDVTTMDKEQRLCIHKAVKRRYGVHVFSNTNDVEGKKIITIGFVDNHQGNKNYRIGSWPRERPEFLHFVLFKENIDMVDTISHISKVTHIRSNRFGFAGTKDKRAVTSQWVCVKKVEVEKFQNCCKLRRIVVGNFCYKPHNLRLGDLKGNRFKIVLRNVKVNDELINEAINRLENGGFINYFGLQRFGSSGVVPTYSIGKAILSQDWKLAVELILKPRPGESTFSDMTKAREIWWETRNASAALNSLTRGKKSIEGKVLMSLKTLGSNAFQNALDKLPKQIVTMYLHSYQSLLWNKVVSRRLREYGMTVLPGDLVKETAADDETIDDNSINFDGGEGRIKVRALTEEEAIEASIYDVLYPLPGDDILLPANGIAQWYTELLQADGFNLLSFDNLHKKYGMYGSYRPMLQKPKDVSWRTLRYSDPDQDLLNTELGVLRNESPPKTDPDGPYKAVVLELSLSVCCYATMAVRELTKHETSVKIQSQLTHQARQDDLAMQTKLNNACTTSNQEPEKN